MSGEQRLNCSKGETPMTTNEHRQIASDLLDLLWRMEQLLKDYCRQLTAYDDGHHLENEKDDEPF
jgi:hypothetical protein